MHRVLILGNGVSRENYNSFIDSWREDLWVCNGAYKDFYRHPSLKYVTTDRILVEEIIAFRKEKGLTFTIFVTHATLQVLPHIKDEVTVFSVPTGFEADSGTTSVVQALENEYQSVYVCGFDLGGKDIYVENHEKKNKTIWVEQWRKIASRYLLSSIFFIGRDHSDFILSDIPAEKYSMMYTQGKDHTSMNALKEVDTVIPTISESEMRAKIQKSKVKRKKVLILGNGTSRLQHREYIEKWDGEIWVCNWGFKESDDLPRIDRVGSVHENVVKLALIYKTEKKLSYRLFSNKPYYKSEVFTKPKGWATGSLMLEQALVEGFGLIVLAGFDMGGKDIYQPHKLPGVNFKNQYIDIRRNYNMNNVYFLKGELLPADKVVVK